MQHVPIPMTRVGCKYNKINNPCCTVDFCPLVPAWATTIHKFQGFEAGPENHDMMKYLIVDPGDIEWEKKCPGAFYVALSRAKTIGEILDKHPTDSSIYWTGSGMCVDRVKFGAFKGGTRTTKFDGEECELIRKRHHWVEFLTKKEQNTSTYHYTDSVLQTIRATTYGTATSTHYSSKEILNRIAAIIDKPTAAWLRRKRCYLKPNCFKC